MRKLLVANRGEIACRVFRTARSMGIATVAVFSDPDEHAPHVLEADEAVGLAGATPGDTYLDITRILDAAAATGADAIHPGYGFLSENAEFARACADACITFVGPRPDVIETMGSKIAAKQIMADAGIPILPGGVVQDGYEVPADGFPVLVKAAFGGGGRGMRIVRTSAELSRELAAVSREAESAFGDGTVFVERYLEDPRHIEVQIFGDRYGNIVHLFERECSIQRRYQKIIEEAPSPAVDADLRSLLCEAAVAAGRALGYEGAGTVEFVLDREGRFYFLEVNTRLQVEHPVTEMVTGLDLVELQLRVARGERLDLEPTISGHAVEARLYAEDVTAGFAPVSGRIDRFRVPGRPGVRVDSGYEDGSTVSTFYDAMIAKIIAFGRDRHEATQQLAEALRGAEIHGPPTNRDLLVGILDHPEFERGQTDTGFLVRHDPAALSSTPSDRLLALAGALAMQADRREAATVQTTIPSGWRNVPTSLEHVGFAAGGTSIDVGYRLGRDARFEVDGEPVDDVRLWSAEASSVELTADGVRRRYRVHRTGRTVYVDGPTGSATLVADERLPAPDRGVGAGSLQAHLPGLVTQVLVGAGEAVVAGQVLVVIEAMKMEHRVQSGIDGEITEVRVAVNDQVENGQVLVVIAEQPDA